MSREPPIRPDRQALLELDALLGHIIRLRDAGDRERFDTDDDYRWCIHRIWIAVGNEALAYAVATGVNVRRVKPWARMYEQRNVLAHRHLPDINDDRVWRDTALLSEQYRKTVRTQLT